LGYFASEYGLTQLAVEEEGKDPAPADLARIIEEARAHDIDYVFVEPWLDPSKARVIVSELGAEIKVLDPLPESYIEGMKDITDLIYEELAS